MAWRIKQLFRKILPFLVIGGVAWGGWNLYKTNFRHGRASFVHVLKKIPYFGSRFAHYSGGSRHYSRKHVAKNRRGKYHHRRRHYRRRR